MPGATGQAVTTFFVAGKRIFQSLPRDKAYGLNDCLVPIYSAQYPEFKEIASYQLNDGRDHGTIRCGQTSGRSGLTDVAALVLQNIAMAESQHLKCL